MLENRVSPVVTDLVLPDLLTVRRAGKYIVFKTSKLGLEFAVF